MSITAPLRAAGLAALMTVAGAPAGASDACRAASGAVAVPLIELYTSQGCSSCPPADRWLSALGGRPVGANAITLALHIGYWDYIGWKDPFAQREFNDRQRWLAARTANGAGRRGIYTPEVFVGGRELANWSDEGAFGPRLQAIGQQPAHARIEVEAQLAPDAQTAGEQVTARVRWQADRGAGPAQLFVAVKRSGYATAVRAGENRGETLRGDHVVRAWAGPFEARDGDVRVTLPLPAERDGGAPTLVAFVQDREAGEVLQSLAVPLAACRVP
jgi:hypothetical protein